MSGGVNVCRLCINVCSDYKHIYNDQEVYDITIKYFDATFLKRINLTSLCYDCWCHIVDFYNFQQTVEMAQLKLDKDKSSKVNMANKRPIILNLPSREGSGNISNPEIKDEPPEVEIVEDGHLSNDEPHDDDMILPELLFENSGATHCLADTTPDVISVDNDQSEPVGTTKSKRKIKPTAKKLALDSMATSTSTKSKAAESYKKTLVLKEIPKISLSCKKDESSIANENENENHEIVDDILEQIVSESFSQEADTSPTKNKLNVSAPGSNPNRKFSKHTTAKAFDDLIAQLRPNLQCEICSKPSTSFTLLQYHCRDVHPDEEFYIMCCNRKYTLRSRLEEHLRLHSNDPFRCQGCGKCFKWKLTLNRHLRKCTPYQRLKEGHGKPFNPNDSESAENGTSKKHKCTLCGKSYTRRHTLREHMGVHTGAPLHRCSHCPQTFIYRGGLRIHLHKEHFGVEEHNNSHKRLEGKTKLLPGKKQQFRK